MVGHRDVISWLRALGIASKPVCPSSSSLLEPLLQACKKEVKYAKGAYRSLAEGGSASSVLQYRLRYPGRSSSLNQRQDI